MSPSLSRIATRLLWWTGLSRAGCRAAARRGRFVLEFHGIPAQKHPQLPAEAQPRLCTTELRSTLAWVAERFALLSPEEFLSRDQPGILLTFDDGFANNFTNALPFLEELSAPAVFFVTTQHVSDPRDWLPASRRQAELARTLWGEISGNVEDDLWNGMSIEQLHRAAESPLITIGSHTVSHPSLSDCDTEALRIELRESKWFLEEHTRQTIDLFAYPKGEYGSRVLDEVKSTGYRAAFAEDSKGLGDALYEIPRIGIYSAQPSYLAAKLSGFVGRPLKVDGPRFLRAG